MLKRFLLLLLFYFSLASFAQPVIVLDSAGQIQKIGQSLYLFEDKTARLTINDIASGQFDSCFQKSEYESPNFNVTKSVIWAHFKFFNPFGKDRVLSVDPPNLPDVRFYEKTKKGKYEESKSGYFLPQDQRPVPTNHFFFYLPASGDTSNCFLRFSTNDRLRFNVRIGELGKFINSIQHDDMLNFFCFGLMWMMIIYNLFLYFTNRDMVYIYYLLYCLFSFQFIFFLEGYFIYYPEKILRFAGNNTAVIPALLGIFSLLFTSSFLNTKKNAPGLHKSMVGLLILIFCDACLNLFGLKQLSINIIQVLGLVMCLISVLVGSVVLRNGYKPATFYLAGFGFYMLGLAIFILLDFHVVQYSTITAHSLQFGSAIEVVMLSLAIGSKMNFFQMEKDKAKEEAIVIARENERLVREQNTTLEHNVEERTKEIKWQKGIIEEKNKNIVSSIEYARRIQRALFASEDLLKKNLPEYFVLNLPKDIVSGDFYWAQEYDSNHGKKFLLCTADCTGHGVPGAFMSLLNISFLNDAILDKKLTAPDLILNKVRSDIIRSLNPTGTEHGGKEGMDCILCSFDFTNNQVQFSCANNPLLIVRDGKLIESVADKFPVGQQNDSPQSFTLQTIDLQKGDMIYCFTDGYADQFGGPSGKKFKYKQLKELLLANANLAVNDQRDLYAAAIHTWKGDLEQVDDILLIGIRI